MISRYDIKYDIKISNALRAQSRHRAKPAALKLDSTWGRKLRQIL